MTRHYHIGSVILISFYLTCFAQKALSQSWDVQWLQTPKFIAYLGERSLRVDENSIPHVICGQDELYHFWYEDNEWKFEIVQNHSPKNYDWHSFVIDSEGFPHVTFYHLTNY